MFDEWRKRTELRRKIDFINDQRGYLRAQSVEGRPDIEALAKLQHELNSRKFKLAVFESRTLLRKARRRGVEVPKNPAWWLDDNENGDMPPEAVTFWLSETGRIGVAKLIREERRKNIEWWVKILTPLISSLIALLGLVVALVSVSRK